MSEKMTLNMTYELFEWFLMKNCGLIFSRISKQNPSIMILTHKRLQNVSVLDFFVIK